jgi:DNA repair photolyase
MIRTFDDKREGKGTEEWSDFSYNILRGCNRGCLYCYAKRQACRTIPEMRVPGRWQRERLNPNRRAYGKEVGCKGVGMFPTSHDIPPRYLPHALRTIRNLIAGGNQVLVVSKPQLSVVRVLCRELEVSRDSIQFRFTIGSLDRRLCAFWEPGAPCPKERIRALRHAHEHGWQTSVSIEPMLAGRWEAIEVVKAVEKYVSGTIWLGKMQGVMRVWNSHVPGFEERLALVKAQQADEEIRKLVEDLRGHPKVRWKDSVEKVLKKHHQRATPTGASNQRNGKQRIEQ